MRKWKRSGSCSCDSEFLRDKVLAKQDPKDCKTLKCSGYDPANETPDDKTGKGDCRTTKCVNGSAQSEADDSDKPDPAASDDNKCKTCKDGDIVADKSKNQSKCSTKEGQECFVCVDGSCKRPDCEDSPVKHESKARFDRLESLIQKADQISRLSPYMNVNFSGMEFYGSRETGKKCCDCKDGPEPKPYEKYEGGASMEGSITVTAPGLGVAAKVPEVTMGWGFQVSGTLEAGVVGRGKLSAKASAAYEKSECKDSEACRSGSMSLNGHVEAVATLLLEAKLRRCADAVDRKCSDIGAIKGETSIGMGADITMQGLIYMGDSCPADCAGGRIGRLAGVARVVASITVGNFYEDSISVDPELVVWEGIPFGEACGG